MKNRRLVHFLWFCLGLYVLLNGMLQLYSGVQSCIFHFATLASEGVFGGTVSLIPDPLFYLMLLDTFGNIGLGIAGVALFFRQNTARSLCLMAALNWLKYIAVDATLFCYAGVAVSLVNPLRLVLPILLLVCGILWLRHCNRWAEDSQYAPSRNLPYIQQLRFALRRED